ncbi:MAG: response regulator transcription factor [Bacteroidia bacterium]
MKDKKSIILVDDHVIVRNGLRELIDKLGPYKVNFEFDSGIELLAGLEKGIEADLIILDLSMPGMNGDAVLEEMNKREIEIPVLILTLNSEAGKHVQLFRLGARGYIQKNSSAIVLREALDSIFKSGYYHNDLLADALTSVYKNLPKDPRATILSQLTDREREFLKLVCHQDEYTYEQIASMMGVHRRTVDGYRESVFDKFDIKSKTGLVLFLVRNDLLDML